LQKNQEFSSHKKASLLASKTFYRLGKFSEALTYAVLSEELFSIDETNDFTMIVKSHLIAQCRNFSKEGKEIGKKELEILLRVLEGMIQNEDIAACYCIAVEVRQEEYIKKCVEIMPTLVPYAIRVAVKNISDTEYRLHVLRILGDYVHEHCTEMQSAKLSHALDDPESVGALLISLATSDDIENLLVAYQISFDLAENAGQKFRAPIIEIIGDDLPTIKNILTRQTPLQLQLGFQFNKIYDDTTLLEAVKNGLDCEFDPIHSAAVLLYSYMYANTADDTFYRNNTEWFTNTNKWHLFFTIAAVGVVHMGHLSAALTVLGPYLVSKVPPEVSGGALYALGLIYANYSWDPKVVETVRSSLRNSKQMYIQYGSALSIGLINIGSQNRDDYETLKEILYAQPVVPETGEAAGYGIGMVMLGCGKTEEGEELMQFAENCEHDKVSRGLSMAFALMMYGYEHEADEQFERLINQRSSVLREGAAWTLALAYVGTGNSEAIQRLLHVAVSDTSSDVRRVAVIGVGFVLSRNPEKVPEMLGLLCRSYHPYVRSGAALAIGIAMAGSGSQEAIDLIKPLLEDYELIVLQSAMIAMAMVLQQQSDASVPYCKTFRQYLRKKITKRASDMTAFSVGAAYGILNATGRNSFISCNTLRGENSIISTVGIAIFCNYFYFIPLALMLPLSFHTSAMIGLDENLEQVEWPVLSRAKPSLFANPPKFEDEKEIVKEAKAVDLSITKEKTKEEIEAEKKKEEEEKAKEEIAVEPEEEIIKNPARITFSQLKYIDATISDDYEPITDLSLGFIMLRRKNEDESGQAVIAVDDEEEKKKKEAEE
jgi:26S proteasome regulatory subunit N2